jgi:hypothetical protein
MMAALAIYLLIPWIIAPEKPLFSSGAFLVRPIFWSLVLVEVLFLKWWTRSYLKPRTLPLDPLSEAQIEAAISDTMTKGIIAFAIAESITIFGFILALIGRFFLDQYLLTLVSGILMVQLYPSVRFFDDLIREGQLCGLESQSRS